MVTEQTAAATATAAASATATASSNACWLQTQPRDGSAKVHLLLRALVLPGLLRVENEIAGGEALLLALSLELRDVVRRHARLELLSVVETRLEALSATAIIKSWCSKTQDEE